MAFIPKGSNPDIKKGFHEKKNLTPPGGGLKGLWKKIRR